MNTPRTYHHGDLRAALVAEGLRQLETGGEGLLSLRAVAKSAGVSANAPYRHFADKNALMGALAAEGFLRFAQAIVDAETSSADPVGALQDQGRAYLEFATAQPALYRLMFSPYGYSLTSDNCQTQANRAFASLTTAVARAQASGWKSGHDRGAVVLSYWSALHGWASLQNDRLIPPEVLRPALETWLEVYFGEK